MTPKYNVGDVVVTPEGVKCIVTMITPVTPPFSGLIYTVMFVDRTITSYFEYRLRPLDEHVQI